MIALISALALGALGFLVYVFMEKNIPEVAEVLNGSSISDDTSDDYSGSDSVSEKKGSNFSASVSDTGISSGAKANLDGSNSNTYSGPAAKKQSGNFGDHIVVDNIPIKNEPKLMAEAIRTIMAQDDDK
jgi:hypothetical protein